MWRRARRRSRSWCMRRGEGERVYPFDRHGVYREQSVVRGDADGSGADNCRTSWSLIRTSESQNRTVSDQPRVSSFRTFLFLKGLSPVEVEARLPWEYPAVWQRKGGPSMKLRRLMIVLAFSSQLAMATPTCRETCWATAEAAAKQCASLPLDQRGACVAIAAKALGTCLGGCR